MDTYSKKKIFQGAWFIAVLSILIGGGTAVYAQSKNLESVRMIHSESEPMGTASGANVLAATEDSIIDSMISSKDTVSGKPSLTESANTSSKKDEKNSAKSEALKEKSPLDFAFEEVLGKMDSLRVENLRLNNTENTFSPESPTGSTVTEENYPSIMSERAEQQKQEGIAALSVSGEQGFSSLPEGGNNIENEGSPGNNLSAAAGADSDGLDSGGYSIGF